MALIQLIGPQNSGKTLAMSYFLFISWANGKEVISNYYLGFPHNRINIDFLQDVAEKGLSIPNISYGLDEFWINADSRRNKAVLSYFFLQSAKDDSDIYATSQHDGQLDPRFRNNVHKLMLCNRAIKIEDKYIDISSEKRFLPKKYMSILYIKVIILVRRLISMGVNPYQYSETKYIPVLPMIKLYNTKEKQLREIK